METQSHFSRPDIRQPAIILRLRGCWYYFFLYLVITGGVACLPAQALELDGAYGDHMVLQRSLPIRLSGKTRPGAKVVVRLHRQVVKCEADAGGVWRAALAAEVAGGPYDLNIEGDQNLHFTDVLIGDVFLFAGQSNMYFPVNSLAAVRPLQEHAHNPNLRLFKVPARESLVPERSMAALWKQAEAESIANFSAIGYLVGSSLQKQLKVPIGLIDCSYPGTPIDAWMSQSSLPLKYHNLRELPPLPELNGSVNLKVHTSFARGLAASAFFNGMVAPLMASPLKAVFWYQGEADLGQASEYRRLFPALIRSWREGFNEGEELPFIFVQMPRCSLLENYLGAGVWPQLREAQSSALALKNVYMAVTIDLGEADNIHPPEKEKFARRLLAIAQSALYRQKVVSSGPQLNGYSVRGENVCIFLRKSASALVYRPQGRFSSVEIAGPDGKFFPAQMRVEKDFLVARAPGVSQPKRLRYAYAGVPVLTIFNKAGLPCAPFRIDVDD
jgi:sialate O-acetylesterase